MAIIYSEQHFKLKVIQNKKESGKQHALGWSDDNTPSSSLHLKDDFSHLCPPLNLMAHNTRWNKQVPEVLKCTKYEPYASLLWQTGF
jgi:hypothetical protein